ncbi:hypothetical protein VD0002_g4248 [Verticillium dahliae]|uniref:trimethyllysine dioxygenase n=1 Tax=Verticillium dahliae TaxID=27337 RepID=A0A444RNM5_VERDA|nr:hypothetical protein VdG2_05048 [Verticillium dahliae VDG2]PNH30718.1 hypothetical protein BJF96_g5936 [Verticillium dahliae]PNH64393.1 hypothetical protein VD0002_g4248 [Verticillium dahliae]RXG42780.1 hypothetical protein VDGE_08368 [Verticillium dahliae]
MLVMLPSIRTAKTLAGAVVRPLTLRSAARPAYIARLSSTTAHPTDATHYDVQLRPDGLRVRNLQGEHVKRETLPHFWLRDNCRCEKCVNQQTMQRNFETFAISETIRPDKVTPGAEGLSIKWRGDGHQSFYPWKFIKHYLKNDHRSSEDVEQRLWGADIDIDRPVVSYQELMTPNNESGIARLTNLIRENGFVFVSGTPFDTPDATQEALEKIAFIRETHYGGFYDFIPDMAHADTAYTNLALPAHTDTTYFSDPAGLQAFHMLSHEAPPGALKGELGGKSLLVDGFYAASILLEEDPQAYEILSKVKLPWHASGNEGITIAPNKRYPVLELDETTGKLARVRWNNDDRGVVPFGEGYSPAEWYAAARKWDAILRRPEVEYWVQLKPGHLLIFDNWRVMHGRSAFEGRRRMCGAYINRDDFISRWRNTNFPREDVLSQVVG